MWERLAGIVDELGRPGVGESGISDVGAVVGATVPESSRARARADATRDVPAPRASARREAGSRISLPRSPRAERAALSRASRSIANAHLDTGGEPAAAARAEAERLRDATWALGRYKARDVAAVRARRQVPLASGCALHGIIRRSKRRKVGTEAEMIITVTLNAAIDKSLSVPNFRLGRRHRTVEQRTMAGGKGVNIARTLKTLGQPVIATGFAGGATGTHIVEQLTEESILNDFVRIREESRTNTSVLDPTTGEQTEINERGPAVSEHEVELFRDKLLYLARGAAIVVFAGSLPRGVEPDIYAVLIRELERTGVTTVIDTDGEPLRQAVRAEPDVVSPNVIEAEELVGHEFASEEERSLAVREIAALGPREAIMTLPDGCFAQVLVDGQPRMQARAHRAARVDRQARLRRRLPGRLRRRALRGPLARPVPALRRRLRRGVHRPPRRRA